MEVVFRNEEFGSLGVTEVNGKTLFIAIDVCTTLGFTNMHRTMSMLDPDEKVSIKLERGGQRRSVIALTESGLYHLVFYSKLPVATAFRRWVTDEVLPTLREKGIYVLADVDLAKDVVPSMPEDIVTAGDMLSYYYNNVYLQKEKEYDKQLRKTMREQRKTK